MFSVENELLENLDTNNLLPIDNDTFEVSNLIKTYDLEEKTEILNTIENQYMIIIDFVSGLFLEKQVLPEDLKEFIQGSYNFKIFLLKNIEERMKSIITKSSVNIFKEIYILLNLLSNGNSYEVLDNNNRFEIKSLKKLLIDYENNISEQFLKNDKLNFELSFSYYVTLLELLNEISIINAVDIQRRKNINDILELITLTISNTKSKINLEQVQTEVLNKQLGKLLFYFTSITYIPIDSKNRDLVIEKFSFMLQKIHDGYQLLNQEEKYYDSFLEKTSTLILTLIYKLNTKLHIENLKIDDSSELSSLLNLYNNFTKKIHNISCETIGELRENLLNNYKVVYLENTKLDLVDYF